MGRSTPETGRSAGHSGARAVHAHDVTDTDLKAAAHGLTEFYAGVSPDEIVMLLDEAACTVTRLMGRPDRELAVDLARLRLDVRTRRAA